MNVKRVKTRTFIHLVNENLLLFLHSIVGLPPTVYLSRLRRIKPVDAVILRHTLCMYSCTRHVLQEKCIYHTLLNNITLVSLQRKISFVNLPKKSVLIRDK